MCALCCFLVEFIQNYLKHSSGEVGEVPALSSEGGRAVEEVKTSPQAGDGKYKITLFILLYLQVVFFMLVIELLVLGAGT